MKNNNNKNISDLKNANLKNDTVSSSYPRFLTYRSYVSVTEKSNTYDVSFPQASISKNNSVSLNQQKNEAWKPKQPIAWAAILSINFQIHRLHIQVARTVMCRQDGRGRFPVLLDDHSKCRTNSQRKSQLRNFYMVCTLNDIYKQYNKLHEHWYTKISSLRCVEDRNPPQNASDLYMKYWSYAEHCRPCTRLSGVNWWKQKRKITLIVPIGYSLFADHRSVPSFGPGFFCLTYFYLCPNSVRVLISR